MPVPVAAPEPRPEKSFRVAWASDLLEKFQMPRPGNPATSPVQRPDQRQPAQRGAVVQILPGCLGLTAQGRQRARKMLAAADAQEALIFQRTLHPVLHELGSVVGAGAK